MSDEEWMATFEESDGSEEKEEEGEEDEWMGGIIDSISYEALYEEIWNTLQLRYLDEWHMC